LGFPSSSGGLIIGASPMLFMTIEVITLRTGEHQVKERDKTYCLFSMHRCVNDAFISIVTLVSKLSNNISVRFIPEADLFFTMFLFLCLFFFWVVMGFELRASALFALAIFWIVFCGFVQGLVSDHDLPTYVSVSEFIGIIDLYPQTWHVGGEGVLLTFCPGWP
jgi:hypothetical protein